MKFTDKANTPFSIQQPEAFLSERALERRQRQGIPVDQLDLPVDPAYISALLSAGQFQLHSVSRWFNAVTIISTDTPGVGYAASAALRAGGAHVAHQTRQDGAEGDPTSSRRRDSGIPKGLYDDVYGPRSDKAP